ncbi:hypothetical protein [Desulfitobacterium chlororespirans]|uniref:Uncharacterized protein n=1 Tax=Desulfitobacterium chlororespirans DSM 11544 TaxID=1121395 RepID=A0A1M7T6I9_9FIRM|nr:hypothetical protein [Desulfitobacterium chlororespirans]SHN66334.1 hypothetical protein SAMN02745215_01657 [Desulfitobacterium chlororespirans DSM 11544]
MAAVKWSLIFLFIVFPLFLLTGDYMANATVVADADIATRDAAQAAIKANVVKNSLRDLDIYRDNAVVQYNPEAIQPTFDESVTRKVEEIDGTKGYITVAVGDGQSGREINELSVPYPTGIAGYQPGGRGGVPPMLAIRSTVVRQYFLYNLLSKFAPVEEYYGIQNEKIAILEVK